MLTAAQKRLIALRKKAAETSDEAEALRRKLVKTCKHPVEARAAWMASYYQLGQVTLGTTCTLCFKRTFSTGTGPWLPPEEAIAAITDQCLHPEAWHTEYKWHHGYGKYVTGVECVVCRARKPFKSQGYWTPYEVWSNWKRDRDDD